MAKNLYSLSHPAKKIKMIQNHQDLEYLRKKSLPLIPPFQQETQDIIQIMIETLKAQGGGAGLTAPQIGINQRIMLCTFTRKIEDLEPMINPEYQSIGTNLEEGWEGCFSVPLSVAKISRWQTIEASYYTPQGNKLQKRLEGAAARIYQHEWDHLEGALIIDKALELKSFENEESYKNFLKILREKQQVAQEKIKLKTSSRIYVN
jgi:peptide deformylase